VALEVGLQVGDLGEGEAGVGRELLVGGVAAGCPGGEFGGGAGEEADPLAEGDGEADRAGAVCQGAPDGLADPPGGVGREAEAPLRVELLRGPDEARVPS
jgi:hypothetical protein